MLASSLRIFPVYSCAEYERVKGVKSMFDPLGASTTIVCRAKRSCNSRFHLRRQRDSNPPSGEHGTIADPSTDWIPSPTPSSPLECAYKPSLIVLLSRLSTLPRFQGQGRNVMRWGSRTQSATFYTSKYHYYFTNAAEPVRQAS